MDFVKESKQLLDYITKLQLNQPVMPPQPTAGSGSSGYGGARTPGAPVGENNRPCSLRMLTFQGLNPSLT